MSRASAYRLFDMSVVLDQLDQAVADLGISPVGDILEVTRQPAREIKGRVPEVAVVLADLLAKHGSVWSRPPWPSCCPLPGQGPQDPAVPPDHRRRQIGRAAQEAVRVLVRHGGSAGFFPQAAHSVVPWLQTEQYQSDGTGRTGELLLGQGVGLQTVPRVTARGQLTRPRWHDLPKGNGNHDR